MNLIKPSKIVKTLRIGITAKALVVFALFSISTMGVAPKAQADGKTIAVSINPIYLIAKSIVAQDDSLELIVDPKSSPHTYSMMPNDARKIRQADLVIWVGPDIEESTARAFSNHGRSLSLMASIEEGGHDDHSDHGHGDGHDDHSDHGHGDEHDDHSDHGHGDGDEHDDHSDHGHGDGDEHDDHSDHGHGDEHSEHDHSDAHIWLSPRLAAEAAEVIAAELSEITPSNRAEYRRNLRRFLSDLGREDARIQRQLASLDTKSFVSAHNAYTPLAEHFMLDNQGYVLREDNRIHNPRNLAQMRSKMEANEIACMIREPQYSGRAIDRLVEGTEVNQITMDIQGGDLTGQEDNYISFIRTLGNQLISCFSGRDA